MLVSYLVDCVLSENIAYSGWGGAFYGVDSPYSQFIMISSSFINNMAYSSYFTQSHGGALMITSKITVNISDCFFANNSALPYLHVVPLTYRYPYSCSCCCCCCYLQSSYTTSHSTMSVCYIYLSLCSVVGKEGPSTPSPPL